MSCLLSHPLTMEATPNHEPVNLQSGSPPRPRVVIIGAGMSGLSAAHHLTFLAPDHFELTVMEASNRLGGRICTASFNGELVEMGATWIHGVQGSPIHDIAQRMQFMQGDTPWECMDGFPDSPLVVAEGGLPVPSHLVDSMGDLYKKLYAVIQYTEGGIQQFSDCDCGVSSEDVKQLRRRLKGASIGEYLREGFKMYSAVAERNVCNGAHSNGHGGGGRKLTSVWNVKALEEGVFRMRENVERSVTAAGSLDDLDMDGNDEYWEYPGEHKTIGHGYSSVIHYLAQSLPKKIIQFNKQVTRIAWLNHPSAAPVQIHCKDGTSYEAEHVIVTVSLGILKAEVPPAHDAKAAHLNRLFQPPLPPWKLQAISKLGFGVVDKCFLFLKPSLADSSYPHMQLVFDDKCNFSNQIPRWMRKNFSFYPIHSRSHVVCTWLTGEEAMEMELLSNEEVIDGVVKTMEAFGFKEKFNMSGLCAADCNGGLREGVCPVMQENDVPSSRLDSSLSVQGFMRSQWGSNPLFRGSYSYLAVGSSGEDIDRVAEPLPRLFSDGLGLQAKGCGRPLQLLFAGEATHRYCYSTTHGAFLSGVREAERLLKYYGLVGCG